MPQHYTIGMHTEVGQRRSHNEDTAAIIDVPGTQASFILCDGMGGLRAGDVASREAVRSIAGTLQKRFAEGAPDDPLAELKSAFVRANDAVNGLHGGDVTDFDGLADDAPTERSSAGAGAGAPPSNALMGTTCVAGVVRDDALYLAHAGDSRAYLFRDGALTGLTEDHSYVAERVRAGDITEAEARVSRFRNMITRAIGIEPTVNPELRREPMRPGDVVLVCSDGLTTEVEDAQIAEILRANPPDRVAADRVAQLLTDAANRAGGSDNITVVLLRAGGIGDAPAKVAAATKLPARPTPATVMTPTPKVTAKASVVGAATDAPTPTATKTSARLTPTKSAAPVRGGIVDIDAPTPTWRPRRAGLLSFGSVLLGIALALGAAIALFALSADARREVARVLRGRTPVEEKQEAQFVVDRTRDFTKLIYDAPVRFSDTHARGDVLAFSRTAGLLCAGADTGSVIALSPATGKPLPNSLGTLPPLPRPSAATDSAPAHFATDPSGDLYIASPRAKTVEKRGPDGKVLLTLKEFDHPEALTVDDAGNLYVVDLNMIKVLRAHEPTAKNPAAGVPSPPAPAKASAAATVPAPAASGASDGGK